jgi:hypothetical protein
MQLSVADAILPDLRLHLFFILRHLITSTIPCSSVTDSFTRLSLFIPFQDLDDGTSVIERRPLYSEPHRRELLITLEHIDDWTRLHLGDLNVNHVFQSAPSSSHVRDLQHRLQRKRYVNNVLENVRAVLPCCRPPNLRCSRYLCHSGGLWPG